MLCVALKPFTTLRSHIVAATTLTCTTVSAGMQLASTTSFDAALLVSAALDLAVLGMTMARLVVFDAPEMLHAARLLLAEIVAGSSAAPLARHANLRDMNAAPDSFGDSDHTVSAGVLVPPPRVPLVDDASLDLLDVESEAAAGAPDATAVNEDEELVVLADTGAASADVCLLYTSPSPRDGLLSRMPSSA